MKKNTVLIICLLYLITTQAQAQVTESDAGGCQAVLLLMSRNNIALSRDQINFVKKNDARTQKLGKILNSCPIPEWSDGLPILRACVEKKMPKNDADFIIGFYSEYQFLQKRIELRNPHGMLQRDSSYIIHCLPFQLDARTR